MQNVSFVTHVNGREHNIDNTDNITVGMLSPSNHPSEKSQKGMRKTCLEYG